MNQHGLTSTRETLYFVLSAVFSVLLYVIAAISIIGIAIALVIFAFVLLSNALMLGSIRGNGIQLSERQFPDVYARTAELSERMGLRSVPDIFLIQSEGALNAFAARFFGRNMVVLYSEAFELAREEGQAELDFIIAHELAHIRRRHIWKSILVMPARFIPFLSQAYSRSCEYTCDREAAWITGDGEASMRALTLLGAGKKMYREVDRDAWLEQIRSESNGAVWLSEILSSHPNLPKRVQAVGGYMEVEGTPRYSQNNGRITAWAFGIAGILIAVYIGTAAALAGGGIVYGTLLPAVFSGPEFDDFNDPEPPPISEAVIDGDLGQLKTLIEEGADIEEEDTEGTTPLHYAAYYENTDAAALLLEAGADPNAEDIHSTALITALDSGDYEMARLLYEHGADPYATDAGGYTAFDSLGAETIEEFENELNGQ
ncbi:M48 family metallopeptidase [Edaphobacillus lindanitolerans]|uniref:Zn-dependent protease with chaperone function n=1 Tax=Edaphobacillus lindanitolerans TaxID=550447 RepID=A0A1U7PNP6_9BACI|nr:M48 family metallopeptidase [Edaphobacillus lindanitolerans]SIT93073.1 Zn-dependent protease with chaperone function [Edaphobacillus lindanitolerans]